MKRKLYVAVWGMSLLAACSAPKTGAPEWFENAVKTSDHQLLYMAEQLKDVPDTACFPRSTKADGSYRLENAKDWTRDRKSTRLNSSHSGQSRMPSSA